jgi:hypothetical protein
MRGAGMDNINEDAAETSSQDLSVKNLDEIHQETLQWLDTIPETDDHWLESCPEAKASVERGLAQAAEGRGKYLGSFAEYADLEIED